MLPENSAHARVASGAYFVQQHAVLIKRGAAGVSSLSGEASGARRSAMAAIAAVGELVAGGDGSAVMVTKSFFVGERRREGSGVFLDTFKGISCKLTNKKTWCSFHCRELLSCCFAPQNTIGFENSIHFGGKFYVRKLVEILKNTTLVLLRL